MKAIWDDLSEVDSMIFGHRPEEFAHPDQAAREAIINCVICLKPIERKEGQRLCHYKAMKAHAGRM